MREKLKIHDGNTPGKTFEVKLEYPKPKVATMSDMNCPFCQQELDCMGKYTDGSSKWLCNKCGLFGDKKLFDEIIRTRKALDVAVDALKDFSIHPDDSVKKYAKKALEQITTLEQKESK